MPENLIKRIQRIHTALQSTKSEDLSTLKIYSAQTGNMQCFSLDFNQGRASADLENTAFSLIDNIAYIKDHLKEWCIEHAKNFGGDHLINTNAHVALIHDLSNTEKHAKLNKPRSGHKPRLINLYQCLRLTLGNDPNSISGVTIGMKEEVPEAVIRGELKQLVIDGQIIDERGADLGRFLETCEAAIEAWEKELLRVGAIVA